MKTEEIRKELQKLHQQHGRLYSFATRNNLDYVSLFKLATNRNKGILHDHALRVISSLKSERIVN